MGDISSWECLSWMTKSLPVPRWSHRIGQGSFRMFSPVGGTIININEELESSPELLNQDPYANYIVIVAMNNPDDLKSLLTPEKYAALCEEAE